MQPSTTVFLASRFEEFSELRAAICTHLARLRHTPIEVLNLDDGRATHRPPLTECLRNVDRSDMVVLLLGDSYGGAAPDHEESFTHLEYRRAVQQDKHILVYACGHLYDANPSRMDFRTDAEVPPRLRSWFDEVKAHTPRVLDIQQTPSQLALEIGTGIQDALHDFRDIEVERLADDLPDALRYAFGEDEAEDLKQRARAQEVTIKFQDTEVMSREMAVLHPEAARAQEALRNAQVALDVSQFGVALRMLERAHDAQPLDPIVNYTLAKFHHMLGRKSKHSEAMGMAATARTMFERSNKLAKAAAASILLAKLYRVSGQHEEALAAVEHAETLFPRYAPFLFEHARYALLAGRESEAVAVLRGELFRLRPSTLTQVFTDSDFRGLRPAIRRFLDEYDRTLRRDAFKIIKTGHSISQILGESQGTDLPGDSTTTQLLKEQAREAVKKQRSQIAQALAMMTKPGESPEQRAQAVRQTVQVAERTVDLRLIQQLSAQALLNRAQQARPNEQVGSRLEEQHRATSQAEQVARASLERGLKLQQHLTQRQAVTPNQVEQALKLFIHDSLRRAPLIPFGTIFGTLSAGEIIRTNLKSIAEFQADRSKDLSPKIVELVPEPGDWWPQLAEAEGGWELFQVLDNSKEKLTLSRRGAYDDAVLQDAPARPAVLPS